MNTLVVHTGAIGDFLLACPALKELAKQEELTLAGSRARLELAVASGIAKAAHDLDALGFDSILTEPSPKLHDFLKEYDRVIVWMRDTDGAIQRGLAACGITHIDVFPGLPDAAWKQHASAYYADCLGFPDLPPLHLPIPPSGPSLDVVIHPGSGSPSKNWPLENFHTIARRFSEEGRRITWCLGPAEIERGFRDLSGDLLQCESLVELAARLVTARFYVGNDSGITHLAAALGVPTVAIFGPTDPKIWAPRGKLVRIMRMRE